MRILFFVILVTNSLFAGAGFFNENFKEHSFVYPNKSTIVSVIDDSATVTITVNAIDTINKVLSSIYSNNGNSIMGNALLSDEDYGLKHLRNANIGYLRLPGGTWSNQWLWDGKNHWGDNLKDDYLNSGVMSLPVHSWNYSTDDMLKVCSLTNATPQICVNFGLSRFIDAPDAVEQAAHYAAEWVRDVNIKRKLGVKYWEVGNENFGSWEKGFVVSGDTITADYYGKNFCVFADSMRAADSTIKIGAVVVGHNEWVDVKDWTSTVLTEVGAHADFLVLHDYFMWKPDPNDVTVEEILKEVRQISLNRLYLDSCVKEFTGLDNGTLPIALTEFNIYGGLKNGSFLAGIFLSRALGEIIKEGYGLANLWGSVNSWDSQNGDMGMLSQNEPGLKNYSPHSTFYPYYYYTRYFGDHLISSSTNKAAVTVYASKFSTGEIGLVITNSGADDEVVELIINDYVKPQRLFRYTLDADSLTSRKFRLNGISGDIEIGGPVNYEEVKPYESLINDEIKINIPKFSMNYLVISQKETAIKKKILKDNKINLKILKAESSSLNLSSASTLSNPYIRIYSLKGKLLENKKLKKIESGINSISLKNIYSSGLYLLSIVSNEGDINLRFKIQ